MIDNVYSTLTHSIDLMIGFEIVLVCGLSYLGITGDCCPGPNGTNLGCCPKL